MRVLIGVVLANQPFFHRASMPDDSTLEELRRENAILRRELARIKSGRAYQLALTLKRKSQTSSLMRFVAERFARPVAERLLATRPTEKQSNQMVQAIAESPLFDPDYCAKELSLSKTAESRLEAALEFTKRHVDECRDPGPLFSSSYYLAQNPDVVGSQLHAFAHFVLYGTNEGRRALDPSRVEAFLSRHGDTTSTSLEQLIPTDRAVSIYVHETGNFFFADIAEYIRLLLSHLGYDVQPSEKPVPIQTDIVVAPHEFMVIGAGAEWSPERTKAAIYVNTEQWQTSWFSLALNFVQQSNAGVIDINPNSAAALETLGFRSAFLPLLPWPGSPFNTNTASHSELRDSTTRLKFLRPPASPPDYFVRPYDILFVGVSNHRRDHVLGELSGYLTRWPCFIHCPQLSGPLQPDNPNALSVRELNELASRSKIMLNIHRDSVSYFEWHRIVLTGIANGSVVVTETCHSNQYLKAGVHYLECAIEDMGEFLQFLLETDEGQRKLESVVQSASDLRSRFEEGAWQWN